MAGEALRVVIQNGISSVPEDSWNALAERASFYASYAWLTATERTRGGPLRFLAAYRGSRLVGALPVATGKPESNKLLDPAAVWDGLAPAAEELLHVGFPRGYHNQVVLYDPSDLEVLPALAAALSAEARAADRPIVAQYVPLARAPVAARLLGDCAMLPVAFDAVVHVTGTFDDYLAALPSKRRSRVRRERAAFAAAGYTTSRENLAGRAGELAPLLANVQEKYGHKSTVDRMARMLTAQARYLSDTAVLFGCRDGQGLRAFSLSYAWQRALYARVVGFDYPRLRGAQEYFNVTYYEPIALACAQRLTRVHYGIESYQAKRLRGAELQPLVTFMDAATVRVSAGLPAAAWARLSELAADCPSAMDAFAALRPAAHSGL